jgi:hypothetical protein
MLLEKRFKEYIQEDENVIRDLELVRDLCLPDCYIAAGYIRSIVWDRLHGFANRGKYNDIDVVFYDAQDTSENRDYAIESQLIAKTGNNKWSVKNQARMHVKNGNSPYTSTENAIAHWPETVTAIGARLDSNHIEILAPYGLEDLFQMTVRRAPLFQSKEYYLSRIENKNWTSQWPRLRIIKD